MKVGFVPTWAATTPRAGPAMMPTTPTPKATPSRLARRSLGAAPAIQAIAPVHAAELARPWPKRAASSAGRESAKPKARLVAPMSRQPPTTVARTPTRLQSIPAGIAETSAPTANAATSRPDSDCSKSKRSA